MSSKASLDVYWGGWLYNSCAPLEMWLNACSHKCVYCFANLNKPDRATNIKQIANLLADFPHRDTYAAYLLREGYPITISNHVDPFAQSNYFQFRPLLEVLLQLGIPVQLLTRFGKRQWVEEVLGMLDRPIAWYVSLTTLDAEIVQRCEPGAPLPEERLELIQLVRERGHQVTVGINPIVPGWIPDPEKFCQRLVEAGVWGVWLNKLHLSDRQVAQMSDRDKVALTKPTIQQALHPTRHAEVQQAYITLKKAAKQAGLEVYTGQQGDRSNFFQWEKSLYPKTFPLMQEFVNHCWDTKQAGDPIYWSEFRDFFVPRLPAGEWSLRDHLNAMVLPVTLYGKHIPQRMDYETLLWHCWRHTETLYCPANVDCFAWAGEPMMAGRKKNTWIQVEDSDGNPILTFQPSGTAGQAFTDNHSL